MRRFQYSNGLRVTGRADGPTLQALNVPAQTRLAQLRVNLQRLRELAGQRIEDRYVLVNVAAFQLEAVERHQVELRHRVIAGKPERQTPTVRATIKAINFFPYWRVPESVAALDLIPRLVKEPDYLLKEQIRVLTGTYNGPEVDPTNIDWRHVDANQAPVPPGPGPQNALGLVRIDMPNEHGVYMHDTPMKQLFNQRGRAFSAGCVRVQDVFTLVEWIAKYELGWDQPGRVQEIVSTTGQPLDLNLTRPVPVYFTYITAWAEPAALSSSVPTSTATMGCARCRRATSATPPRAPLRSGLRALTAPGVPRLGVHPEQTRRVAAQDRRLLVVGERRGGEDVVDRMLLPRDGMVGAEHDLARADLRDEVAQRLGREDERVEIELVQVLGRLLLEPMSGLQFCGETKQAWSERGA